MLGIAVPMPELELVGDEEEFWKELSKRVCRFDLDNPELETAHEKSDRHLIELIDQVVHPYLGPHGYGDELWFENLDFFGDGVRQLSFRWSDVAPVMITELHGLLVGEHEHFCILCKFHTQRMETGDLVGLLALFHGSALATPGFDAALRNKHV